MLLIFFNIFIHLFIAFLFVFFFDICNFTGQDCQNTDDGKLPGITFSVL